MEEIALEPHQRLSVHESTDELLYMEARWEPGGNPPIAHFHPAQEEEFEVLEGELTVIVAGEERALRAGDRLTIPPGTVHAMWNAGTEPAAATWEVRPALNTHEMFRTIASGGVEDFLERYSAEFRLAPWS